MALKHQASPSGGGVNKYLNVMTLAEKKILILDKLHGGMCVASIGRGYHVTEYIIRNVRSSPTS